MNFHSRIEEIWITFSNKYLTKEKFIPRIKNAGLYLVLFILLYGIGSLIPEGFDWIHYYKAGRLHPIWTPWSMWIIKILAPCGFGLVFALSAIGIGVRSVRYNRSPFPLALAILSLPTLWVIYMGNLDGLVLLGMLIMPVGIPLVLMKPQVSAFSLLARKDWLLVGILWVLLSLILWGFWPKNLLMVTTSDWKAEWTQDISIFPWGILLGLPLLWFSRGDQDLLMAAGSLMTPHLFPYHFIILMPSLGRMRWYWMLITWAISWTPLLANWLGPTAWHFGNLMSLCFWFGIYLNKKKTKPAPIKSLQDLFVDSSV
jgi:hypothetical protein